MTHLGPLKPIQENQTIWEFQV